MENKLAVRQQTVTPMTLIERAAANGSSIEQMAQLFELKLRVEADEARKAYYEAFSAFKAEAVRVVKNIKVKAGPLKGSFYADLFGVVNVVTPALSAHGLSHSWKLSKDEKDWMEVTCTIRHILGHSESVSMGAAPDTGPGRNAIQARASAKTYLERYTLLAATGMAAEGTDNDGAGEPDEALQAAISRIQETRDLQELQEIFAEEYQKAKAAKNETAMKSIIAAKDAEKAKMK